MKALTTHEWLEFCLQQTKPRVQTAKHRRIEAEKVKAQRRADTQLTREPKEADSLAKIS